MSVLIDVIYMIVKKLWKASGLAAILLIAFVVEIIVLANWKEAEIKNYFRSSDITILNAEIIEDEEGFCFFVLLRNDSSKETNHLPDIILQYDDNKNYLEAENIYAELGEARTPRYHRSTLIPGKTEVTLVYKANERFYPDELKQSKNVSMVISEYDTIDTTAYWLNQN